MDVERLQSERRVEQAMVSEAGPHDDVLPGGQMNARTEREPDVVPWFPEKAIRWLRPDLARFLRRYLRRYLRR